jgi:ribonuclease HI
MGDIAEHLNEQGQEAYDAHLRGECGQDGPCQYCEEKKPKENHHFVELYVDGGVFGRNGQSRGVYWSVLVEEEEREIIRKQDRSLKWKTNNDAEWLAVREALLWATSRRHLSPIVIYSDSRHVVDCFNEKKHIKIERHVRLYYECKRLVQRLPFVALKWVPREVSLEKVGH